jgi:hypothetical protein
MKKFITVLLTTVPTYFFGESSQVGGIPTTRQVPLSMSRGADAMRGRLGALRFRELATNALSAKWARRVMQCGRENIFASNVPWFKKKKPPAVKRSALTLIGTASSRGLGINT